MEDSTLSIKLLTTALADELLSKYQYWTSKHLSRGEGKFEADGLFEHMEFEEEEHVENVVQRLKELGGVPMSDPADWQGVSNPFVPVDSRDVRRILAILIEAERAAINFYTEAVEQTSGVDEVTCQLFREILMDETEHHYELQELAASLVPGAAVKTASRKGRAFKKASEESPMSTYYIENIVYDFDDDEYADLPVSMELDLDDEGMDDDEIEEELADMISDTTGFCVKTFNYECER